MKKMKKGLAFILSLAMAFTLCETTIFADSTQQVLAAGVEDEETTQGHLSAEASDESVSVGDEFTVTLSLAEMDIISFTGGLHFDSDYVECEDISKKNVTLTGISDDDPDESVPAVLKIALGELKTDVGMYFVGDTDVTYEAAPDFVTVTFKALKAGTANFNLYEDVDGNEEFKSEAFNDFSVEITSDTDIEPEEPEDSDVVFSLVDADGDTIDVTAEDIESAESVTVTEDEPWTYNDTNTAYGTFYSVKSLLESEGVDVSEAHGLKVVATDGFTSGYSKEDLENLYIYEMSEVIKNGAAAGEAGTYGAAINGSKGNKWATDIATIEIATDHVWFVKKGKCQHYCSICGDAEPSITLGDADGTEITVYDCDLKSAESVTVDEDEPWTYKNGTNTAVGTFYSLQSILEGQGVDVSEAHGLKVVAKDGFTSGFTAEDIENLYIYEMSEVEVNGATVGEAGTYGTAINGGAGNKWAKDIATVAIATDHVWFVKNGTCKHYCSICEAAEPSVTLKGADGSEITVYDCDLKSAESVTVDEDEPWTYNGTNTAYGTFYSVKSILESQGVDVSEAHGLKVVATDGFTSGYTVEELENLYIYEMSEVTKNGAAAGEAGTYGAAINGSKGNKWASDIATIEIATGHVWFVKGGTCKHYCSICSEAEPSITVGDAVTVYDCEIKSAESVTTTAEEPWTYTSHSSTTEAVGTFYSLTSILENKGIIVSDIHELTVVATDSYQTTYSATDLENLYVYEMSEITKNGEVAGDAGTYGTALKDGAAKKWAKDIASITISTDHVLLGDDGVCQHKCTICGAEETIDADSVDFAWDTEADPITATVSAKYACGEPETVAVDVTSKEIENGTEYTATYTINGEEKTEVLKKLVNSITASNITKNASASKAQTVSIGAKTAVEGTLSYAVKTANSKITVNDKGTVTIPKNFAGKATIIITATADNCEIVTKEITVTVNKIAGAVTASNVTKTAKTSAQSFKIGATRSGSGALTYSSSSKSVTVDKNGKVTIAKNFVGSAKITIKAAASGIYKAASKTITVTVNPAGVSLSSVTNTKGLKMTVKWKKNAKATGYQIQYSTSKSFKSGSATKTATVSKASTVSKVISSLTKGKTYYVRIRTYKTVSGKKYYSGWSTAKTVKISK
jgi:hypothetical protein